MESRTRSFCFIIDGGEQNVLGAGCVSLMNPGRRKRSRGETDRFWRAFRRQGAVRRVAEWGQLSKQPRDDAHFRKCRATHGGSILHRVCRPAPRPAPSQRRLCAIPAELRGGGARSNRDCRLGQRSSRENPGLLPVWDDGKRLVAREVQIFKESNSRRGCRLKVEEENLDSVRVFERGGERLTVCGLGPVSGVKIGPFRRRQTVLTTRSRGEERDQHGRQQGDEAP